MRAVYPGKCYNIGRLEVTWNMSIIGACMVPHPPIILPEIGRGEEKKIAETTASYEKAADLVASLKPDTLVIASPHTRMYADWFYIGGGSEGYGSFSQFRAGHVRIHADYDTEMIIPLDHGVMIPLYFIRKKYTDFKIVRIGISGLALTDHYRLGMMIRDCAEKLGRRVFFVASGDLSHKLRKDGPYGFIEEGPVYDTRIMDVMGSGDFKKLFAFDSAFCEKAAECGHRSFVMMAGAFDRTAVDIQRLSHQDIFGVGYGICLYRTAGPDPERNFLDQWAEEESVRLAQRKAKEDPYVQLARLSVETYIRRGRPLTLKEAKKQLDLPGEMLSTAAGAFVSLHIGTISACCSCIAEEIIQNAVSACSRDYRFHKVAVSELPLLEYSVDILGEAEDIAGPDQLDVKRYGVIVSCGRKRGLLLPDLEGVDTVGEQIRIASAKAGISEEYDRNIRLQRFEVIRHT